MFGRLLSVMYGMVDLNEGERLDEDEREREREMERERKEIRLDFISNGAILKT